MLETASYEFQRFDAFEQHWKAVEGDAALAAHQLPPDLVLELVIEGRPILLRHEPNPDARVPAARRLGQRRNDALPPRLRPQGRRRVTLVGGLDGGIEIERGDDKKP